MGNIVPFRWFLGSLLAHCVLTGVVRLGLLGGAAVLGALARARARRIASLPAHTTPLQAFFVWLLVKGVGMQGNAV